MIISENSSKDVNPVKQTNLSIQQSLFVCFLPKFHCRNLRKTRAAQRPRVHRGVSNSSLVALLRLAVN